MSTTSKTTVASMFFFMRNDEKKVASLSLDNGLFIIENEKTVEKAVNAEFLPLEKALTKLVKAETDAENAVIIADAMKNVSDLKTLRENAVLLLTSRKVAETVSGWRVYTDKKLKLVDLSKKENNCPYDFTDVVNAVTLYDSGNISGKELQNRIVEWYNKNGLSVEMTGKRSYVMKHAIATAFSANKRKFTVNAKTALIAYSAICDENEFNK